MLTVFYKKLFRSFTKKSTAFILQATLKELEGKRIRPVTQRQADSLATRIEAAGNRAYLVSALTGQGVREMMNAAIWEALIYNGVLK